MTGELAILNVSAGDTKLTFDPKNKGETKRACAVVTDMLKRGFCVLIEVGKNEAGPLYQRVKKFDPKTAEYIVAGAPEESETDGEVATAAPGGAPRGRKGWKAGSRRVPAASARAVAVAPTSGG